MFKVLLIVYVLGGGGSENVKNTYNTNFVFQEFHSMTDCELAVTEMDNMLTWNRTKDGEKEDKITVLYSTKCVPMTATGPVYQPPSEPADASPSLPDVAPITQRKQSRWND